MRARLNSRKLDGMQTNPPAALGRPWRPWTLVLPGVLALVSAGVLAFIDVAGLVMGSWDTPAPGLHWLRTGIVGQCVLAAIAVTALLVGANRPSLRRAAVGAWTLIPVEFGWFLLTARLARG
jgi:hypothetical protein